MKTFFAACLLVLLVACGQPEPLEITTQAAPQVRVSPSTAGTPYTALGGSTQKGKVYIYAPFHRLSSTVQLTKVGWVLDGKSIHTDSTSPYTLTYNGGLFDTTRQIDGQHDVTVKYYYSNGTFQRVSTSFAIKNAETSFFPEPEQPTRALLFEDNFDGTALNRDKWDSCYPWGNEGGYSGFHGTGNCYNKSTGETQLYTANSKNLRLSGNGTLILEAHRETVTKNGKTFPFTSAMIASHPNFGGGFTTKYGYIEARMRLPVAKGVWPAFWTLPYPVEHPPEIDIHESIGDQYHRMHYHYDDNGTDRDVGKTIPVTDLREWHTYAVDWQPGLIVWYLDGVEVFRTEGSHVTAKPQYLLLNLAIDGWAETPDAGTPYPQQMEVDFVRVYDRK